MVYYDPASRDVLSERVRAKCRDGLPRVAHNEKRGKIRGEKTSSGKNETRVLITLEAEIGLRSKVIVVE